MWKKPERRKTVDCQHVEAALIAYLKDGLSPTRRQAVEDHLAACDACARSVQQAQILESELRLQAARHNPTLSPEAVTRIHERVYKRMRRGLMMQRTVKLAGVAVAVVVIALLAAGAMALWQERPPEIADEQDVTPEFTETAVTAELDQLLDDYFAAWNAYDADAVRALLTDGFMWYETNMDPKHGVATGVSSADLAKTLLWVESTYQFNKIQRERLGEPIMTGDGPWLVAQAWRITAENYAYPEIEGITTLTIVDEDGTPKVARVIEVGFE
jgi:uncharacterized protein (DUF2267 family)